MQFFLVDIGTGAVIANVTVQVGTAPPPSNSFTASPNPIVLTASGQTAGTTTLSWNAPGHSQLVIHVGSPTGTAMTGVVASTGSATTGTWVANGMQFFLVDPAINQTVASTTVTVTQPFVAALITSPTPGAKLTQAIQTFSWSSGASVSSYYLTIGTAPGRGDILSGGYIPPTTTSLSWNIPQDGSTFYVLLTTNFTDKSSSSQTAQYTTTSLLDAVVGVYSLGQGYSGILSSINFCNTSSAEFAVPVNSNIPQSKIIVTRSGDTLLLTMANVGGASLPTWTYQLFPPIQSTANQLVYEGIFNATQPWGSGPIPTLFYGLEITRDNASGTVRIDPVPSGSAWLSFGGVVPATAHDCTRIYWDSVGLAGYSKPI